jgi:rRNA biogenesis protein RRP5
MDKPNVSTVDLWAGPKDLRSSVTSKVLVDDDTSPSESEDSDYVDEYEEETEDEGVEGKDMKIVDFDESIDGDGEERTEDEDVESSGVDVDEDDLGEDESDKEESKDYDDNSD